MAHPSCDMGVGTQAVANLALTERTVVSFPAGTEIYVILQNGAQEHRANSAAQPTSQPANKATIDELRQLMQLQRELNQPAIKQAPE
jgi:hypothetical protein